MYKKIVLLLLVSVACSKHIAIIGCGAGGAASAYFLNGFNVTIFEKASYCGGRTDFIQVENKTIELGGTFFVDDNKYMKHFAEITGSPYHLTIEDDQTVGIFDGGNGTTNHIVMQTSTYEFITMGKLLLNYGLSPLTLKKLADRKIEDFLRIYKFLDEGNVLEDYNHFLRVVGFEGGDRIAISTYLKEQGIGDEFIEEFVAGVVSGIYNQDYSNMHTVGGMISLIATFKKTYSVTGGNRLMLKRLVDLLQTPVKYNTEVVNIDKISNGYRLHHSTNKSQLQYTDFDTVIIATLQTEQNHVHFNDTKLNQTLQNITKSMKHQAAHIYVIAGHINPKYFGVSSAQELPKVLLSKNANKTDFTELQVRCYSCYKNGTLPIYMIQARHPINDTNLSQIFLHYELIKHQHWNPAYPLLTKDYTETPHFELDQNLFYVNSMEYVASVMEMEMLSAHNIANRIIELQRLGNQHRSTNRTDL